MKWSWGIFAVFVVGAALLWIVSRPPNSSVSPHSAPLTDSLSTSEADSTAARDTSSVPATAHSAPAASVDPVFQKWIAREAKQLDAVSIDSDAKLKEIRQVVARLTPGQSKQLLNTARSTSAHPGEKILSTFLLVEAGEITRQELGELIATPLENSGDHQAHSAGEVNANGEKSLRIMAIDGLASQAKKDPRARDTLAKTIPGIQDPYVRGYAQDRLAEVTRQ